MAQRHRSDNSTPTGRDATDSSRASVGETDPCSRSTAWTWVRLPSSCASGEPTRTRKRQQHLPPTVILSEGVRRPSRRIPIGSVARCFPHRRSELRGILRLATLAQNDRVFGLGVFPESIPSGRDALTTIEFSLYVRFSFTPMVRCFVLFAPSRFNPAMGAVVSCAMSSRLGVFALATLRRLCALFQEEAPASVDGSRGREYCQLSTLNYASLSISAEMTSLTPSMLWVPSTVTSFGPLPSP